MMNSRKTAVAILEEVFQNKAYSNIALKTTLNKYQFETNDRALITEIVYGTIKYKYTIDTILRYFIKIPFKKVDSNILNILRISIYQMKYLTKIPQYAVVNEAVDLAKKHSQGSSKFVNGVLRNYLRNTETDFCASQDEVERLCFKYSFEKWMVKSFINQYGIEKAEYILAGLNETPYVSIRINTLKTNLEEVTLKLEKLGYNLKAGNLYKNSLNIVKGSSIENNPLFKEGLITVQDESAMLAVDCMDIQKGMNLGDLCAAPGGKSTHMSEILNNTGNVSSFDIYEHKVKLIKNNAKRLGISNLTAEIMNAEEFSPQYVDSFDALLVDVPCSGLGIIKKKPEIKWFKDKKDLEDILKVQKNILNNACKYVKGGGTLIYSTCTLNKKENEETIIKFLKDHPNYELQNIDYGSRENILYPYNGMITILPNKEMDGFFISKLKRKA
ncbi:16S rRNA (cytosine(967)-C(5))-methyltransferase RsmB [Clostridium sp. 19966]|uniref:16S rRNA (cytosine(967)-C(5))-methyltransferase RsmB n=1 Tax=Clostridium sp. 19966 TaxID=2768166 RepID=UPI0028DE42F1|nr:16S rRNA (cytosine(967)-C(5))-methyltransferase RsmB [Clostridium sp. 19966]MDT8716474.1 16S rRNA (cytosine(967)-C(5))-methyltransferase RsmB [Clostridium sp. 19966]